MFFDKNKVGVCRPELITLLVLPDYDSNRFCKFAMFRYKNVIPYPLHFIILFKKTEQVNPILLKSKGLETIFTSTSALKLEGDSITPVSLRENAAATISLQEKRVKTESNHNVPVMVYVCLLL